VYRVWQFGRAVGAWVRADHGAQELAARFLPPEAARLHAAMPRYDRRHAVSVARALLARDEDEPALVAAALLHDVGKTAGGSGRLRLWHRVAVVLLWAASPRLLAWLGRDGRPGSWRAPFYVQLHHAAIGAELAEQAGCSSRTVELIRRHEDRSAAAGDPQLAVLQAVDDEN
jgi:putative nucleotidyltransferase with HDIG domain